MNSSEYFALTYSNCHPCEPCVKEMHDVTAFSTVFAYNSALSARIYEGLNWMSINFSFDVEHCYLTKKFWTILERCLIIRFNHAFANFFFNLFLGFNIVWVGILELQDSFLVRLLFINILPYLFANNLFKLNLIISDKSLVNVGVDSVFQTCWVLCEHLFELFHFRPYPHVSSVVIHLIKQLPLR